MAGSSGMNTDAVRGTAWFARAEREEYQGEAGAERPLGDYLVIMAVYGGLVGVLGAAARLSHREIPERIEPWDLLVMSLATHKLSRIIAKDKVTSPLRAPFTTYQGRSADKEVREQPRGSGMRKTVGELLGCPFCLGMWVATGLSAGLVFAPRFTRLAASTLTVLAGSDFLQYGYAAMQQNAQS